MNINHYNVKNNVHLTDYFYTLLQIFTDFHGFLFGPWVPKNPYYGLEKNK